MSNIRSHIEHRKAIRSFLACCVVASATLFLSATNPPRVQADVVFIGPIVTVDESRPSAGAIAVKAGRIVAIGSESEVLADVGNSVRRMRLPGTALPGLADAHIHVLEFGHQLEELDLRGLKKEEIVRRVAQRAAELPSGSWIEGRGWDQGFWNPAAFPVAADLDAASPIDPVILTRIDGHSIWVNSAALRAAGIRHDTADPDGGRLMHLPDGSPSGVFVDKAVALIAKVIPKPAHDQLLRRLETALHHCVELGLTSVHDAGVSLEVIALYKEMLAQNQLPLRAYVMALGTGETATEMLKHAPEPPLGDGRLSIRSFKVFLDGALGSRGAELLSPYSDAPNEHGLELTSDADFQALVKSAAARGYQVNVHAIGDKAVRRALDGFEKVGGSDLAAKRFRIEHASVVDPSDLGRFARLHVIVSTQPIFVGEYSRWAQDRLGPVRASYVLPVADLFKSGAVVAVGTDFPASDSPNPILSLYSMVTRKGADGTPAGGWHPEHRVDVMTALRAMTWAPAFAAFEEQDLGVLALGRLADLTVLSADPRTTPPEKLKDLSVTMTIVGGIPVYEATTGSTNSHTTN
jgi:predicted amidohydrolase YtcJ